jgi:hypothetical protein
MHVVIHYRMHGQVEDLVFGLAILRGDGFWYYGSNTDIEEITLPPLSEEGYGRNFPRAFVLACRDLFPRCGCPCQERLSV